MFVFFAVWHGMPRYVLPLAHPYSWLQPTEGRQSGMTPAGSYRPGSVNDEVCEKFIAYINILTRRYPRAIISLTVLFGSNILSADKTSGARLNKSYKATLV